MKVWGGKVIARILPLSCSDYHLKKSKTAFVTKELIPKALLIIPQTCPPPNCEEIETCKPFLTVTQKGASDTFIPSSYNDSNNNDDDVLSSVLEYPKNINISSSKKDFFQNVDESTLCVNLDIRMIPQKEECEARGGEEEIKEMIFNMKRKANEPLGATLRRVELNMFQKIEKLEYKNDKQTKKRSKKEKLAMRQQQQNNTKILIKAGKNERLFESFEKNSDLTNVCFWRQIANLENNVFSIDIVSTSTCNNNDETRISLSLESCPPTIISVSTFEDFNSCVFVGVPIVLLVDYLYSSEVEVTFLIDDCIVQQEYNVFDYTPTINDVGKTIFVKILPFQDEAKKNDEYSEVYKFAKSVEPFPTMPIMTLRQSWSKKQKPSLSEFGKVGLTSTAVATTIRVLSYNLLADLYASREEETKWLYPHCLPIYLHKTRRMPMLLYEILSYQADIICLQEVDGGIFDSLYRPVLQSKGYEGYYSNKASGQREGCAMFWRTSLFTLDTSNTYSIKDLLSQQNSNETNCDFDMKKVEKIFLMNPEIKKIVAQELGQITQVVTLRLIEDRGEKDLPGKILVANTHLFFHPMASHLRILQTFAICRKIHELTSASSKCEKFPFLLCGDLNSSESSGPIELLRKRSISSQHRSWRHFYAYKWDDEDDDDKAKISHDMDIPELTLPTSFPHLISGYNPLPDYSNFVRGFVETLDYIFASSASLSENEKKKTIFGFEYNSFAEILPRSEIEKYTAMPNEVMPSDHVALVCDLTLKRLKE